MYTFLFLQICIVMHLIGLVLMVGTNTIEFFVLKGLSKAHRLDRHAGMQNAALLSRLSPLLITGAVLLVLSGTGFLLISGDFARQLWFKIKIALVFTLVLNGFLLGSRYEKKLKECLMPDSVSGLSETDLAIRHMMGFYFSQLCLFLVIIVLAVIKPG